MASNFKCSVEYQDTTKNFESDNYENLKIQISEKFSLGVNCIFSIMCNDIEVENKFLMFLRSMSIPMNFKLRIDEKSQTPDQSTIFDEGYDTLDYIIYSLERQEKYRIYFPQNTYLNELSDLIISERGMEKSQFVCFFYSLDGQPLATSFYASQFIKVREVLSIDEKVYVIITKNIFTDKLVEKVTYERTTSILATFKKYNKTMKLKINMNHDKKNQIKDLIGFSFGYPSSSIYFEESEIQNLTEGSKIAFSVYEYGINIEFEKYNTIIPQTNQGLRLLRGFAICLPYHINRGEQTNRFIACIRYIVPFNPFIYSLYHCADKRSISESELISFNDGIYYLFSFLHNHYRLRISNDRLFEYTLEFFALLLEITDIKSIKIHEAEKFEIKSISHAEKMREPVIVPLTTNETEIYDMPKIEELKSNNGNINKIKGSIDHLKVDLVMKMLIKRTEGISKSELVIMMTKFDSSIEISEILNKGPIINKLDDFESIKKKRYLTEITSYLDLKEQNRRHTLTYNLDKNIVVNLGLKICSNAIDLKDVFSGSLTEIEPYQLAKVFKTNENDKKNKNNEDNKSDQIQEENFSRIPDEAIAILLDTSGSMGSTYLNTEKSRLSVAKDFLNSFINRSLGYNLPQVISLTTFDNSVKKVTGFTENAFKFCESLEKVVSKGNTSIFDAIMLAINNLNELKKKYNNIKARIICFSDGEDNSSTNPESLVLKTLVASNLILDCINLGEKCISLKNVSLLSGGFAFWCDNIEQGYKIFESDAFISVSFRIPSETCDSISVTDLKSNDLKDFTQIPPPFKKPTQIELQASTIVSALVTMEIAKPKFQTTTGSLRFKRINREMALIHKSQHPDIQIYPCDTDIQF